MDTRKVALFRKTYAATGSLAASARAAGIPLDAARRLRAQVQSAQASTGGTGEPDRADDLALAVAALESEAVRRALEGVEVPVFHQGRECGSTVKHSDTLLMFLLKTLRPERYGSGRDPEPSSSGNARPVALEVDVSAGGED